MRRPCARSAMNAAVAPSILANGAGAPVVRLEARDELIVSGVGAPGIGEDARPRTEERGDGAAQRKSEHAADLLGRGLDSLRGEGLREQVRGHGTRVGQRTHEVHDDELESRRLHPPEHGPDT